MVGDRLEHNQQSLRMGLSHMINPKLAHDFTSDNSDVKLIKELEDSIVNSDDMEFGPMVDHPLVRHLAYHPAQNLYLNKLFKSKQEDLKGSIRNKKWENVLMIHERPWRAWAFIQFSPYMKPVEYWENLARVWIATEFPHHHKDMWLEVFDANIKQKRKLMTSKERQVLQELPSTVTIYRGYNDKIENTLMGISWTLSEEKATWFANRFAAGEEPRVAEGLCEKSSILAYFEGRDEKEVVVNPINVNIMDNRPVEPTDEEVLDTS